MFSTVKGFSRMQRLVICFIIAAFLTQLFVFTPYVQGSESNDDIYLLINYRYAFVNGDRLMFDENPSYMPVIEGDRTFVPLDFAKKYIGASLSEEYYKKINELDYIPLRMAVEQSDKKLYFSKEKIIVISNNEWSDEMFDENKQEIIYSLGLSQKPSVEEDEETTDVQVVRKRLKNELLSVAADPATIMRNMREDGSFSNVGYYDIPTASNYPALAHVDFLITLGQAYNTPGNKYYKHPEVKQKYILGLIHWVENDYQNAYNWFYQEIGTPESLTKALIVKTPGVPKAVLESAYRICARSEKGFYGDDSLSTGANLVSKAKILFRLYIELGDEENVEKVVKRVEKEVFIANPKRGGLQPQPEFIGEEGIMPDMAFNQHGPLIQSAHYGAAFISSISSIMGWSADTKFQLKPESYDLIANSILDGFQYMFRNSVDDASTAGRAISLVKQEQNEIAINLEKALNILTNVKDINRKDELLELYNNRLGNIDLGLVGSRNFWTADYFSHNRSDYQITLRTSSIRTKRTENINGQNILGYYLGDGVTFIRANGKEYNGIYPVWDWNMLPGTTSIYGILPVWGFNGAYTLMGNTSFVGGVSDGLYGAVCMDLERDGLLAKKSYFMFDEGMVAVGNGITYGAEQPIYTTINQTSLNGEVTVSDEKGAHVLEKGTRELKNVSWVLHNGVGYYFPIPTTVMLKNDEQAGSWSRIVQGASNAEVTMDVFNLWINHGTRPMNKSYQYAVVMGATAEILNEYTQDSPYFIEQKDGHQAVYNKNSKVLEATFWEKGSVSLGGLTIKVDKPCVVTASDIEGNMKISVANPLNEQETVQLEINRVIQSKEAKVSGNNSTLTFVLPGDDFDAGKSVYFDEIKGFSTSEYRYEEERSKPKAPPLIGLTFDGEPINDFKPNVLLYKVELPFDYDGVPEVAAFGDGNIVVKKSESLLNTFVITTTAPEDAQLEKDYYLSYTLKPKEGLPEANELKITGVTAGDFQAPNAPENTLDGNIRDESRWSSMAGDKAWIKYDLGEVKTVDYLAMAVASSDVRQTLFTVLTSEDGLNWTTVYDGRSSGSVIGFETYALEPANARYVRINGHGNSVNSWTSITEVKIFSKES